MPPQARLAARTATSIVQTLFDLWEELPRISDAALDRRQCYACYGRGRLSPSLWCVPRALLSSMR
ncbi:MAG: hypothetical protein C3F11_18405 [Methylocystaceae bacterium]|nr:MAG: hypothetical protein C3F11_18405 [Methylocystaceae bacterium]